MANTITNVMEKILAKGLNLLRNQTVLARLTNGDYSADAKQFGDTIDIPVPVIRTATDVTPSNTPPTPNNTAPTKVQISLNKWKKDNFFMTDKDMEEVDRNEFFVPSGMQTAISALAEQMNTDLWTELSGAAGAVLVLDGSSNLTYAFGSDANARSAIGDLNQVMAEARVPVPQRRVVLSPLDWGDASVLQMFTDASAAATDITIRDAVVGRKFGFDWAQDQQAPLFTFGTGSGYLVNNGGGYAIGATTIAADTGSGTILVGDVVKFAGHANSYAVTTALSGGSFVISPGLRAAVADNEAITVVGAGKGQHKVNVAFHRDAVGFAMRSLDSKQEQVGGSIIRRMQDQQTGMVLRLEVSRQYKQTVWEFDVLYGVKLVRPELAVKIASKAS